jgi:CheY-like chemotaxis protein
LALLAARKLLLADDSITIQKIVALTFADEGIEVIAVDNGAEAIEKLDETSPDIVLADIFMPVKTGYQVCEHIRQTDRLKHIPVMLMVGSFEPFDEVEARRVGADDILTKPFQSIRTLMEKVGALLGRAPAADHSEEGSLSAAEPIAEKAAIGISDLRSQIPDVADAIASEVKAPAAEVEKEAATQELPPPEVVRPPEEPMTTEELEITTADTLRLSPEIRDRMEHFESERVRVSETVLETETMHTNFNTEVSRESSEGFDESLLDLDNFEPASFGADDDVILDIDFDAVPLEAPSAVSAYTQTVVAVDSAVESPAFNSSFAPVVTDSRSEFTVDSFKTGELEFVEAAPVEEQVGSRAGSSEMIMETAPAAVEAQEHFARPESVPAGPLRLAQISPAVIDAIARRVVEQLSEKVVQEIAWEVVPQLAELMIKRRLEEQETQKK